MWRSRGRAPNQLVGVGTTAFGFDSCDHYLRTPESFDPRRLHLRWASATSLCHRNGNNNASRINANVLRRFLDETPFT